MRITEPEIWAFLYWAFLLGAAIGSIVTYFIATREKRIISSVRREVHHLASFHDLTPTQWHKTEYPTTLVSGEQILALRRWAKQSAQSRKKSGIKLDPTRLAAEVIICEELLGLPRELALSALINAKDLNDLRNKLPKKSN
jgi:hypothetical protein